MASKHLDEQRLEDYRQHRYDFATQRWADRVVLVSGGTGGLGAAFVAWLLTQGAIPMVAYKANRARAQRMQGIFQERFGRPVHLVSGDITYENVRTQYLEAASSIAGVLYGLACFVGDPARVPFADLTQSDVQASLTTNYVGPVMLAKQFAEVLMARQSEGSMVFISSMQGVTPFEGSLNYGGPKAALVHAAKIYAKQWRPHRLRVNVVAPGATVVGMAEASIRSGKYDGYVDSRAVSRFGYPEDVASAVGLLLQPDGYITGQVVTVDGGLSL